MRTYLNKLLQFLNKLLQPVKKVIHRIYIPLKAYVTNLAHLVKENIRDYGMFIALAVIFLIFGILNSSFLTARNISSLVNETGYIAVLSIGVTLVIVIRHIDLSIGFVSGFIGALAAILMVNMGVNVYITILLVLMVGTLIGLWHGFLVAYMRLPAFVATLAGMLIFRGAILQTLQDTGTIIIPNEFFNSISGYVPDFLSEGIFELHALTILVALAGIALYIYSEIKNYKTKLKYEFKVLSKDMLISKIIFVSLLIFGLSYVLAQYNGLPWTLVILLIIVSVYHFFTKFTVLGRHIYAVGGNPEAAELSGISVKMITLFVFGSMGFLSAVSGIMFASRLGSATTTAGTLFELQAIAGAFVGGVSATGGIGKVAGSVIGAFVMASISNGLRTMGVGLSMQYIIQGLVLVAAVIFDIQTRKKAL